jgi:carnosine N-methyltransferase
MCNHKVLHAQVAVPDVLPGEGLPGPGLLGMCGGEFVEVYSAPQRACTYDCVATCFFMDTAHNIIAYMQTIWHTLKV